MSKIKKRVAAIGIILLCVLAIFTFVSRSFYNYSLPRVNTMKVSRGTVDRSAGATGQIVYTHSPEITALGEWTLAKVNVANGDKVKQGDILCTFDTRASDITMQSLQLDVMHAQDALDNAAGSSRAEAEAQTALNLAQEKLDLALSTAPPADGLTAPGDGTVYGLTALSGDTTAAGETLMTIISDKDTPRLAFTLPSDVGKLYTVSGTKVSATVTTETYTDGGLQYNQENLGGVVVSGMLYGGVWNIRATLIGMKGFPSAGQDIPLIVTEPGSAGSLKVSIGCLFDDGNGGKCVYVVSTRAGLFGDESYVTQTSVTELYDNGMYAAISASGLSGGETLAYVPTRPLFDGGAVWVNE